MLSQPLDDSLEFIHNLNYLNHWACLCFNNLHFERCTVYGNISWILLTATGFVKMTIKLALALSNTCSNMCRTLSKSKFDLQIITQEPQVIANTLSVTMVKFLHEDCYHLQHSQCRRQNEHKNFTFF